MSEYPSPALSVEMALRRLGGWCRMFRTSQETRDERDILVREGDPDFWRIWVLTRCEEEFRKDLEEAVNFYRSTVGVDRPKSKLRADLERELKKTWKPDEKAIRKEMRQIRKAKKEELSWLRQTLR